MDGPSSWPVKVSVSDTNDNLYPNSYRKALRMMHYADHHGFPIITFIDTPGAYADLKSEELGQVCGQLYCEIYIIVF